MWDPKAARPAVTEQEIVDIVDRMYGFTVTSFEPLSSYDDRNFLVHVSFESRSPYVKEPYKGGYVLKICSNWQEESGLVRFEAQAHMMLQARTKGITCPEPTRTIDGRLYAIQSFQTDSQTNVKCLVRLCTFVEGEVMSGKIITSRLMEEAGALLGMFHRNLEDFPCEHLGTNDNQWSFSYIPKLRQLLPYVTDEEDKKMAEEVIDAWQRVAAQNEQRLPIRAIHGDFNEHNILVRQDDKDAIYHVCGILDFGDASAGFHVHDLGILIMYMMTFGSEPVLDAGGHVLRAYRAERKLDAAEESVLYFAVAARLVQSLIIGLYSYSFTGDKFQLETQKPGWAALRILWSAAEDMVLERWRTLSLSSNVESDYVCDTTGNF